MSIFSELSERLGEENPKALTADGFEDAAIGILRRFGTDPVMVYDYDKCIEILIQDGMDHEDAVEFFELNTIGAWMGEGTPAFLDKLSIL